MRRRNLIGLCVIVFLRSVAAQTTSASADAPNEFSRWTENYLSGKADFAQGVTLARERRAIMRELIRSNPADAIRFAVPAWRRDRLPAEIVAELETPIAAMGDFTINGAVRAQGGPPVQPITREAMIGNKRYRAYTYGRWNDATTRQNIFLQGVALENDLALDEASAPSPNESLTTTGNQNVLIIRVDFSDLPGDPQCTCGTTYTAGFVQNLADTQIAPFYQQSSYGATSLTNTATTQVYRLPQTAAFYATNGASDQLHTDAETAAAADYTLANFQKIIVLFSSLGSIPNSQITYGGQANIGGPDVWVNGEFDFRIVAHELGHTFGLFHANVWQVNDGSPISPGGTSVEYADPYDTMGENLANDLRVDFNAWFKNRLGWISSAGIQDVTTSGTYRVYNFDDVNATGILGLRIRKDASTNYWVTCRRKFTDNPSMQHGAYVFWGYNISHQSNLLDMTTPGVNLQDAALALGAQFSDASALVTIKPIAEGGTAPHYYIDVAITVVPSPANDNFANAQLISGSQGSVQGTNVHATTEPGEPFHTGNIGGASVWYVYTPATSGPMTFDTFGSDFNTLLGVYAGNLVSELQVIASNDDATANTKQSRVTFNAVAGATYHIAVDGFNAASGNVVLNFTADTGVYSVSTSSVPSSAGLTSGGGTFGGGSLVTVIATANSGYGFVNWTENGTIASTSASYIFTLAANRVLVANFAPASQPLNLSTRAAVGTLDNVVIGGFIITGSDAKKVILRALGPSLGNVGLQGVLSDPNLELRDANNNLLASNDNWRDSQQAEIEAAGLAPADDRESAIVATLAPGAYTSIMRGVGGTTGIGLVEIYDGATNTQAKLANLSSRGKVQTGDSVMIGGFIVGPGDRGACRVIVRALGPSLNQYVAGTLPDTTLDLFDGNGNLLSSNDDWRSTQQQEILATGIPPGDDRESAIVTTLSPGAYTAILRGKNDSSGVALVEVYLLN